TQLRDLSVADTWTRGAIAWCHHADVYAGDGLTRRGIADVSSARSCREGPASMRHHVVNRFAKLIVTLASQGELASIRAQVRELGLREITALEAAMPHIVRSVENKALLSPIRRMIREQRDREQAKENAQ
ncbi:MAG TPA: hypothetical protein VHX44_09540, partial [Planctomycetota bacterium]|nr:hypothetical protein [Planctomycetota bacterium]